MLALNIQPPRELEELKSPRKTGTAGPGGTRTRRVIGEGWNVVRRSRGWSEGSTVRGPSRRRGETKSQIEREGEESWPIHL